MSFFGSRLKRLEEKAGGTLTCEACRYPPGTGGIIVLWTEERPYDPQERCSGCGRYLWVVIKVVYDDSLGSSEAEEGEGDSYWPNAPA